jgi:hypothetical protein
VDRGAFDPGHDFGGESDALRPRENTRSAEKRLKNLVVEWRPRGCASASFPAARATGPFGAPADHRTSIFELYSFPSHSAAIFSISGCVGTAADHSRTNGGSSLRGRGKTVLTRTCNGRVTQSPRTIACCCASAGS